MMSLEIKGIEYGGFTSASSFRSIESISGAFNFRASSTKNIPFPAKIGDECRVLIDGKPVNNGFIEGVSPSYSGQNHELIITGRDKTADMIDSSTLNKNNFQGTVLLSDIIKQALEAGSITGIEVIDNAPLTRPFNEADVQASDVGESIFEFCDRYARKLQVLLTGDGNGNIVITRSGTAKTATGLFNVVGGTKNNILSASASYSSTDVFNKYVIKSQSSLSSLNAQGSVPPSQAVDQSGTSIDDTVRKSRQLEITPPASMSSEDAANYALWQRNVRRARAFTASIIVHGHKQGDGSLWQPNMLVDLHDDFLGRKGTFLIKSVTNNVDNDKGETTSLELVERDAYTLEEQAVNFETDNSTNTGLF